jgi:hypothetical protein
MTLKSDLFRGNPRVQAAARNAPVMKMPETSVGAALVQAALLELGFKLPVSTRKKNAPDGIYGEETASAVSSFQSSHPPLKADGVAGNLTLHAMDKLLKTSPQPAPKPPKPQPPPPKPPQPPGPKPAPKPTPPIEPKPSQPPPHNKFKIGSGDPALEHDAGSGAWNSEFPSARSLAIMAILSDPVRAAAFYGSCFAAVGPNATRNLKHYFGNTGAALTIPYPAMARATPRAFGVALSEVDEMLQYIDSFPTGTWPVTSKEVRHDDETYNYQSETRDWFFAIGGYGVWTKATATVEPGGQIQATVTVKFYDRYNWDGGKQVTLAGITITDEFMAEFHRQGFAKEYDCFGQHQRSFTWVRGNAPRAAAIVLF